MAAAAAGEGKKKGAGACELCGAAARVYCGADEATLCWGCDAQVHGANFLVARHARALLCRGCAQPTPWRAAGPRLGPTASLCERCVRRGGGHGRGGVGAGGDDEMAGEGDGREDEDDEDVVVEEDDEEEGEGENQVVPWAEEAEATPPPVASSTSSSSREAAANVLSVNGETKTVMKGITHGACNYLLKPVRIEELRNIWQHVVRRKFSTRDRANLDTYEECSKPPNADSDHVHGQVTCGSPDQSGRPSKKRKEYHSEEEDEGEESNAQENDDPSAPKKPRVVWSVELHRKFVAAVNQLGIDKAVPKRILETMNVDKLSRENVASHLQKYRLYLKRLSAVASQQASIVAALGGRDPFLRMGAFEGLHGYQAFNSSAALSSFSPRGLLNSPRNNPTAFGIQGVDASRSIQSASGNCTMNHSIGDANKYHLSLPGNQQGNLAQGLATSLGQAQLQQKWIHEETDELSTILSGNALANGMSGILHSVTSSSLLPQDLMEGTQAKGGIQPSIRTPRVSSEHLEGAVGVSSSLLESHVSLQSALPLPGFSASGLLMHGSFDNNSATKLGATSSASTPIRPSNELTVSRDTRVGASYFGSTILLPPDTEQKYLNFGGGNSFRQKMDGRDPDSLLDSKLVWSSLPSSQLPSNIGVHDSMSQRSNNGSINSSLGARMIGQTSASASTVPPQIKMDALISDDMLTPKNASDLSIQKLQSELSSSSCSFDGLLNSMIKAEKDDVSFSDDLGCGDFYPLGACI